MSYSLDLRYAALCSMHLKKFKKTKDGHFNFRCPYCGDSKKNPNLARGWFYTKKQRIKFKCHNCGQTESSIMMFLKKQIPSLYTSYLLDKFRTQNETVIEYKPSKKLQQFKNKAHKYLTPDKVFDKAETNQKALEYIIGRGIDESHFDKIYYTNTFRTTTNELYPGKFASEDEYGNEYIIFPLLKPDGEMKGFQGRCITPCSKGSRFITIVLNDDDNAIYGLEGINPDETVYIHEGPIDSLFIPNSIALCGANNAVKIEFDSRVYVLDSDTRNHQIIKRMKALISQGEQIVVLPKIYSGKDINDLYLEGHDVLQLVKQYTFSGMKAKLELTKW